ncbi:MAG: glycine--tRNA ligase [Chloroflexi bacterium]|nr:glycine--tRNA ligase [Chloroflexota bacterium]
METLVSLCRRRGFIFQSSEIYGGLSSCWDYGPLGVELKRNVKEAWWRTFIRERDDVVGLDTSILMHPRTWEASGHLVNFTDPLVECKSCNQRFRADQAWAMALNDAAGKAQHYVSAFDRDELARKAEDYAKKLPKGQPAPGSGTPFDLQHAAGELGKIPCPACDVAGKLTEPRQFNLMFKTFMGPVEEDAAVVYLRPETCQGIFVNFENVLNTTRKRLPFGIAQIGKSFRNEITTGNFIFRVREFEQMELEYFVKPGTDEKWFDYWVEQCLNWYTSLGVKREHLRLHEHGKEELSHYSSRTVDIHFLWPMGWDELMGIANRGDFDLTQQSKFSGKELSYFDEETKEHIVPFVIEPSAGLDRAVLAFLCDAYDEDTAEGEKRVVLRFHPTLAPYKAAVLPLSRKENLAAFAKDIHSELRKHLAVIYDDTQSIGRRYRRQDEIGTPFSVTVDFQSLEDKMVTIRDRDSMNQIRVPVAELQKTLAAKLAGEGFLVLPPGGVVWKVEKET